MKLPLSKLYKITPPTRLHLISRDKPDSFSSRRSLLVAAFSYIIKKCIPPHPSRYSPFIVMRFARNLAVLGNYHTQPRQIPASNHAPWHADAIGAGRQCHPQFYSSSFYVTNRFFVSFLVRPALLPCGKRGFRAAICKIARPQPPAAAL